MLNVIELEHGKFLTVIQGQTAKEVTAREKSIQGINEQIEGLSKQRDTLATELIEQRNEIGIMQTSFDTACNTVGAEINDSLNKLRIYAPAPASAASK